MEDEKLAAYYDDLTRRGSGASRFKQGLGFSSGDQPAGDAIPSRGSALTSSSFFSGFVRASSPSKTSEFEKQAQLQSIQNKLSRKPKQKARSRSPTRKSSRRIRSRSRSRSSSRDRISDKHSRHRSRSRSRSRGRYSRRRSRSRSRDRRSRRRSRSHEDKERRKHRSRSRSREKNRERSKREVRGNGGIDYAKSIDGYDNMTPAERVRAKMKLQLSKTAEKDETIGKGSGWERFDFDKDAPLDEEEIEEAEDDAVLVKNITQSFRFSAVEARREDKLKAAHDEAMFGGSSHPLPDTQTDNRAREEGLEKENTISAPIQCLLSEQILTMQRGSWRDRARKS